MRKAVAVAIAMTVLTAGYLLATDVQMTSITRTQSLYRQGNLYTYDITDMTVIPNDTGTVHDTSILFTMPIYDGNMVTLSLDIANDSTNWDSLFAGADDTLFLEVFTSLDETTWYSLQTVFFGDTLTENTTPINAYLPKFTTVEAGYGKPFPSFLQCRAIYKLDSEPETDTLDNGDYIVDTCTVEYKIRVKVQ